MANQQQDKDQAQRSDRDSSFQKTDRNAQTPSRPDKVQSDRSGSTSGATDRNAKNDMTE